MAAGQPSPQNDSPSIPPKTHHKITIKGVEVPVSPWAIVSFSVLAVLFVASFGGIYVWKIWRDVERLEKTKIENEAASRAKLEEYKTHFDEKAESWTAANGAIEIRAYPSDGCIFIKRKSAGPYPLEDWAMSPQKTPKSSPPDSVPANVAPRPTSGEALPLPPVELKSVAVQKSLVSLRLSMGHNLERSAPELTPVQGSCLNPHPGPFASSWGAPNGCWIPFFRSWRDGCSHYQWYNNCTGYWDPGIHWNSCAAQHYY